MESKTLVVPGFVRRPRRLWDDLYGISVEVAFWEAVFDDFDVGFADDFDFVIFETNDRRNLWEMRRKTALRREFLRIQFDSKTLFWWWVGNFIGKRINADVAAITKGLTAMYCPRDNYWWKWRTVLLVKATDESSGKEAVDDFHYQWIAYQWIRHCFWTTVVIKEWENRGCFSAVGRLFEVEQTFEQSVVMADF